MDHQPQYRTHSEQISSAFPGAMSHLQMMRDVAALCLKESERHNLPIASINLTPAALRTWIEGATEALLLSGMRDNPDPRLFNGWDGSAIDAEQCADYLSDGSLVIWAKDNPSWPDAHTRSLLSWVRLGEKKKQASPEMIRALIAQAEPEACAGADLLLDSWTPAGPVIDLVPQRLGMVIELKSANDPNDIHRFSSEKLKLVREVFGVDQIKAAAGKSRPCHLYSRGQRIGLLMPLRF